MDSTMERMVNTGNTENTNGSQPQSVEEVSSQLTEAANSTLESLKGHLPGDQRSYYEGLLVNLNGALPWVSRNRIRLTSALALAATILTTSTPTIISPNVDPKVNLASNSKGQEAVQTNGPILEWVPTFGEANAQIFGMAEKDGAPWEAQMFGFNNDANARGFGKVISAELERDEHGNIVLKTNNPKPETIMLYNRPSEHSQISCQNSQGKDLQCMFNLNILQQAVSRYRDAEKIEVLLHAMAHKDLKDPNDPTLSITESEAAVLGIDFLEIGQIDPNNPHFEKNPDSVSNVGMKAWCDTYFFRVTYANGRIEYITVLRIGNPENPTIT